MLRSCPPNKVIQPPLFDESLDLIMELMAVFSIMTVVMMVKIILIGVATVLRLHPHLLRLR